jgi:hypothetical protein
MIVFQLLLIISLILPLAHQAIIEDLLQIIDFISSALLGLILNLSSLV